MPKRVLLIEDNAAIRRTLAAHLTAGGYAVTEAVHTEAAFASFRQTRPDVVVLDADLARGNPFELIGKLRNEPAGGDVPLLLLSRPDRDDMSLFMQALDAHAIQAVLHKPVNYGDFMTTLAANNEKVTRAPRKEARVAAELGLKVKCKEWDRFVQLYTKDISRGGMFLTATNPPPVLTRLRVQFELPDSAKPFILHAEVAHIVDPDKAKAEGRQPGMGIRFLDLSPEVRAGLEALIEQATTVRFAKGTAPQAAEQPIEDEMSMMPSRSKQQRTVPPRPEAASVSRATPPAPPPVRKAAVPATLEPQLSQPFGGVPTPVPAAPSAGVRSTLRHEDLFSDVPSLRSSQLDRARELLTSGDWQEAERVLNALGEVVAARPEFLMAWEWASGLKARAEGRLEDAVGHLGLAASQPTAADMISHELAACQAALAEARKGNGFFRRVLGR